MTLSTLALCAAGCGDSGGRTEETFGDDGMDEGIGDEASSTGTEAGESTGDTGSTGSSTGGDGNESSGIKLDLAPIPDAPDCGEGGGGGNFENDFSYIWIANSTQGTVSKIDTVSTVEEGRYFVTDNAGQQPSRTSVNQFGDVAAGHRFYPRVTKVAAVPERCVDKNMDGMITTSSGPGDILPYGTDECVLWTVDVGTEGNGTRAVAWEGGVVDPVTCTNTVPNPRLWVAYGSNPLKVVRLEGETGAVLDTVNVPSGGFVYGGAVNADGDFWVSDRAGRTLSMVDSVTLAVSTYNVPGSQAYGVAVDENGHPWIATYEAGASDHIYRFDPDTAMWTDVGGVTGRYRGMVIDRDGRAWVAGNSPCRLALADALNDMLIDDAIELPGCSNPVGTSVDRDGYIWVVDQAVGTAWKLDPDFKIIVGTVTGLVAPYTYSDMTGQGLNLVVNPPG
ncbi:hypothetical protein PPSIR1_36152 [Plesiocystis pacifica SIR-1]|uniref:Virginiamycin B lyase n=1 Tax=Plesiocystis pacifica SIR-1 TaxID=391625 RepID=A6G209_9BACT|nr:hypothetical protein [Plesiocystis pacifica]EDM80199.1 hypothetical protein PPSIR1_36152 [Plesiocystis pacifica SIR-1]